MPRAAIMAALSMSVAASLAACGASNESSSSPAGGLSGTLNGAGSTAQEVAMSAWQKAFQTANPDATVNYDGVGSGGGRDQFLSGAVNFAGSDAYLATDEIVKAKQQCGSDPVEVPVYVSPIALVYNLSSVPKLNLSPATVAQIFAGKITKWNDQAIAGDNPGATLPSTTITPVHRSDDSGTTENFTEYLSGAASSDWSYPPSQTWPLQSGEAGDGTPGVISAVKGGDGAIGYADASQAGSLGKASIKVGSGYVQPTAAGAAKDLDESQVVSGRAATDIAVDINRTPQAADAYPILLVSYQIMCQKQASQDTANLIKAFETYVISDAGQQAAAQAAGSAPLPASLKDKAKTAIDSITGK